MADLPTQAAEVGNALASVRLDQLVLSLAHGVAWGQYELDKIGVDVAKMMGVPGTIRVGGEALSMLDAGLLPSFYQFVETILELNLEVKLREEEVTHVGLREASSSSLETESGGEVSSSVRASFLGTSYEQSMKASWKARTKSAYSRAVDAGHTQQYGQELGASSSMQVTLAPRPPPDVLVERLRILLERLRAEAAKEVRDHPERGETLEQILMERVEQRLLERAEKIVERPKAPTPGQ